MKVAVVNTHVPFVRGGAEQLAEGLVGALRDAGHEPALVRLPFFWHPDPRIVEHMLAARLTPIPDADLVVGLKFPAYLVPHPNKVLWLLHQHRQAYDLWGTPWQGIADTAEGRAIRAAIIRADTQHIPEARRVYTISGRVAERMRDFNGIHAEVLYPPLLDSGYQAGPMGDYVFYPSRINVLKRQTLVVEAMRHVRSESRLVIAGQADTPEVHAELTTLLAEPALADRVTWLDGWIPHEQKVRLMSESLACVFTPLDEDYGYVTVEAFSSSKPVITCDDSGGPLEFVQHDVTGMVVPPEASALGEAIDTLAADHARTTEMGLAAHILLRERQISWERVVEVIVGT